MGTQANWLSKRQLESMQSTVTAGIIGNAANGILLFVGLPHYVALQWQLAWLAAVTALLTTRALVLHGTPSTLEPRQRIATTAALTIALGLSWGIAIAFLFVRAETINLVLISMIAAGMMYSGSVTMRSVPHIAISYVLAIALPTLCGFLIRDQGPTIASVGLLVSFCVFLIGTIRSNFREYLEQAMHERTLHNSNETIKLLLHDYAEQGSDWLFETDIEGRLTKISDRLPAALGIDESQLIGQQLGTLFNQQDDLSELIDHIHHQRAFHKTTVAVTVQGLRYWWTVSGRPYTAEDTHEVLGIRGVITDVTAEKTAEARVSYMAHYDGLTDLPNRVLFNEALHRAVHRRQPNDHVAVLFLDLDQFKSVNDTLGHPIGDRLLQAIAQRLELCISPDDMVARLGGDEFAMLLTGNDAHIRAEFVANCVIEAVNAPVELDGHYILPATSIGIAIGPDHGDDADTLLRNADLALYVAKHNGRNRFAAFAPGMDVAAQARRQLETDMRNALASDQLRLVYQPLVDINTREVSGYEALLRWEHPERGTVMPVDFIPVAEETGLIVQLGEWVIRTGLTELAHWHAPISLSINLSPTQMRSGNLIPTIINALARANVDPGRVEFEITETVLMHDTDANLAVLHRLRDIGVRISLDDFGTGYSSLNYLRSFPFDKIKIDRCFVTDVDVRTDCQAIVKAVTGLATSLGMTTTAEGVEHEAQLEELRAQGCSQVQGYLFSHAVPADQLTDLRRRAPILPHAADTVILPAIGTIPPRARRAA